MKKILFAVLGSVLLSGCTISGGGEIKDRKEVDKNYNEIKRKDLHKNISSVKAEGFMGEDRVTYNKNKKEYNLGYILEQSLLSNNGVTDLNIRLMKENDLFDNNGEYSVKIVFNEIQKENNKVTISSTYKIYKDDKKIKKIETPGGLYPFDEKRYIVFSNNRDTWFNELRDIYETNFKSFLIQLD